MKCWILFALVLLLFSCNNVKEVDPILYFSNRNPYNSVVDMDDYSPVIRKGDFIYISVINGSKMNAKSILYKIDGIKNILVDSLVFDSGYFTNYNDSLIVYYSSDSVRFVNSSNLKVITPKSLNSFKSIKTIDGNLWSINQNGNIYCYQYSHDSWQFLDSINKDFTLNFVGSKALLYSSKTQKSIGVIANKLIHFNLNLDSLSLTRMVLDYTDSSFVVYDKKSNAIEEINEKGVIRSIRFANIDSVLFTYLATETYIYFTYNSESFCLDKRKFLSSKIYPNKLDFLKRTELDTIYSYDEQKNQLYKFHGADKFDSINLNKVIYPNHTFCINKTYYVMDNKTLGVLD